MGKHILLIGVSAGELAVENADPAIANVDALKKTLLAEIEDLREDQVITLLNPDLRQMRHAIALTTYRCRHGDLCMIYYTGCGVLGADGAIYLPASDTRLDAITTTAISSDYIRQALPSTNDDLCRVMILDCLWGTLPDRSTKGTLVDNLPLTGLADCNCTLLTAIGSLAHPWPTTDSGISVYTHCLIDGITTGLADIDADGNISCHDLQIYMDRALAQSHLLPTASGHTNAAVPMWTVPTYSPEREYRRSVEEYVHRHDGHIPPVCRNVLEFLRHQLGLTWEQGQMIETAVMAPYVNHQESCDYYRQALATALTLENPLGNPLKKWLRHLQRELDLSYDDIAAIETGVFTQQSPTNPLPASWLPAADLPKLPAHNGHTISH